MQGPHHRCVSVFISPGQCYTQHRDRCAVTFALLPLCIYCLSTAICPSIINDDINMNGRQPYKHTRTHTGGSAPSRKRPACTRAGCETTACRNWWRRFGSRRRSRAAYTHMHTYRYIHTCTRSDVCGHRQRCPRSVCQHQCHPQRPSGTQCWGFHGRCHVCAVRGGI